ncbi:hypothetical protein ElyMa_004513500 [Elysia marginata]|uniref:Ubiquitin thioesterase OTU n=1 Tax=Elysia marginata TaxID=1093978 RepID=A0AAV4HKZ6_9GAST|nr:hypothetical protein ElyMa_004513500 [Elysia marginata]
MSLSFCNGKNGDASKNLISKQPVIPLAADPCCVHYTFAGPSNNNEVLSGLPLCLCEVDVSLGEEGCDLTLAPNVEKENSMLGVPVVGGRYKHNARAVYPVPERSTAIHSIDGWLVKTEAQRRIDELNFALSKRPSPRSTPWGENKNTNNSSSASLHNTPSINNPAAITTGSTSQDGQRVRKLRGTKCFDTRKACRTSRANNPCRPITLKTCGTRNHRRAFVERRSSLRYHPYPVMRHRLNKYSCKFPTPSSSCVRKQHVMCDPVSTERENFFTGHATTYHTCSKDRKKGRKCCLKNCYFNKHSETSSYSPKHDVSTDWKVSGWRGLSKGTYSSDVSRGITGAGEISLGEIFRRSYGRELQPRSTFGPSQNRTTVSRDLDLARLPTEDFLLRPSQELMGAFVSHQLSNSNKLVFRPIRRYKESKGHLEENKNRSSVVRGKFSILSGGTFPGNTETSKECFKTQPRLKLQHSAQFISEAKISDNVSIEHKDLQNSFTFSKPLVARSKPQHETVAFLPVSQTTKYTQRSLPSMSPAIFYFQCISRPQIQFNNNPTSNMTFSRERNLMQSYTSQDSEKEGVNTANGEDAVYKKEWEVQERFDSRMGSTALKESICTYKNYQTESSDENFIHTDRHPRIRNILKKTDRELETGVVSHHTGHTHHSAQVTVSHRNDTDITTNNSSNNNDTARPINNNSCNLPSSTQPYRPSPLGGRVVRVEGDGRCLFRSLVTAECPPLMQAWRDEYGRPVNRELSELETARADQLRARVVTIMSDNMHFYSQLEKSIINADQPSACNYQRFLDRLRAMSEPSTMPGDLELNAVAMVMERQILVLDTNLVIITSYGHDRFPQSLPLAVRYTRLVPDVGHYDAVILSDDHPHLGGTSNHSDRTNVGAGGRQQGCPVHDNSTHSDALSTNGTGVCPKGGYGGDATLNAKKEFFYLRDSDKSLHSDGLQPVTSLAVKTTARPVGEQRTAEATTSTARAAVHWPPNLTDKSHTKTRRKRRTFSDKFTQTEDAFDRPKNLNGRAEWKKHYYQYRYGIASRPVAGSKRRAGTASGGGNKKVQSGKRVIRGQNINWNSRVRKLVVGGRAIQRARQSPGGSKSLRIKKNRAGTFTIQAIKVYSPSINKRSHVGKFLNTRNVKSLLNRVPFKNTPCLKNMGVFDTSAKSKTTASRNSPTRYINICSPARPPKPAKPENTMPRAASPSVNSRRRKSVIGRNRSKRRRAQTVSPGRTGSPRSPLLLTKKPRLPDAFEPAQCRCVLCNTKIEAAARESVKCFMCGRMAHRACVMKESSLSGQGGGDQNYFICSFCVPL